MQTTETTALPTSAQPVRNRPLEFTAQARHPRKRNGFRTVVALPGALLRAAQIVFAKATVACRQPPLLWDLGAYGAAEFEHDVAALRRMKRQIDSVPADAQGMRWIHQGDTVLYYAERDLDLPYDEFVSRVDISRAALMFRDVVGVSTEVLSSDDRGRAVWQLERMTALPQPNYSAFLGKVELDIYKLERIEYGPDEQRNWMCLVHSPNGSAISDAGYLAFVRVEGGTRIAFLAYQHFPMPWMMVLTGMDRWKRLTNVLTESAYRRFFNATIENIRACYEGREFRIGRRSTSGIGAP